MSSYSVCTFLGIAALLHPGVVHVDVGQGNTAVPAVRQGVRNLHSKLHDQDNDTRMG